MHFRDICPNLNLETKPVWELAVRFSLVTRTATPRAVPSTWTYWSLIHRSHVMTRSICPEVLPAARDWKDDGESIFSTPALWSTKPFQSHRYRKSQYNPCLFKSVLASAFKGVLYFKTSATSLYRVSFKSSVLVNIVQTGKLYSKWVQGSPPAPTTTGHLPSRGKPDTNTIYGSRCRTRQAS